MHKDRYTTNEEDYKAAQKIAVIMSKWLLEQTNGHFLISMEALDLVQDGIQHQALLLQQELKKDNK